MQILIIVTLSIHVLAAAFWMGSTMSLARNGGMGFETLFRPQMVATTIVVLSGGYLWHLLHSGGFGKWEISLTTGVVCAIIAAGIQGARVGPLVRKLNAADIDASVARTKASQAHLISGALLAIGLISMVIGRYL